MSNSKDIFKLQPGATYAVKVVPKGAATGDPTTVSSLTTTFVVPTTNNDGSPITATNSVVNIYQSTSTVFVGGATMVAASNFFFNASGMTVWQPGTTASVFYINAKTGNVGIKGNITATSGTIGGFTIANDKLTASGPGTYVGISGSGTYAFWAGNATASNSPFYVTNTGAIRADGLTATNSVVVGSGPAGNYAGITPNSPYPYAIWAGADTASGANSKFYVTNSGSLVAQSGSFVNSIFSGTSTNSGSLIGGAILVPNSSNPTFKVDSSGNMTASNAYISGSIVSNSGNIGGWNIVPNALYSSYSSGSFAAMSPGTLSGASANYVFWAGNSNPASAPFSVKADGTVVATGISVSASLVVGQSGGKYTGIIPANNLAIFGGASDPTGTGATFSVTNSGSLYATIGTIGGWNITPNELYIGSGTQKLALNTSASPKIYVGNGVFSDAGTGFFVDNKGNFSLGNQLTFVPSQVSASTVKTTANVSFGSNTITPVYDNSSQVIINGTLVTGSALPTGTYVTNVTYGVNPTITLNNNANATDASSSVTFQPDNLSLLNVVGKIRGIVDSVNPISAPTLYATITSASINTTASVIYFTSNGHFFSASSILILENLPSTNGLSNLNYAASSGNAYVIASVPNSINFTINTGSVTGLTSGNITSLSGKASIQQLTMGLHVAENPGTSYAHQAGTGVRLDEYNWWFTNNQFRVGNPLSYMQYTATGLQITGGDTYSTIFKVGPTAANNIIAIYSPKTTVTTTLSGSTINYVDTYFNSYTASGTTISTVANNPTFSSSTTPFYVDGSGQFSLGNKFQWSGSAGTLILGDQTGGTVGFQAPSNPTPTSIALYAGTGAANSSTAPFRVNYQGDVFASSASITGNITASAGSIGGWSIGASAISSGSINLFSSGSTAKIYIGSSSYQNEDNSFYADGQGRFSVSNKFWLEGNTVNVNGRVSVDQLTFNPVLISQTNGATPLVSAISDGLGNIIYTTASSTELVKEGIAIGQKISTYNMPLSNFLSKDIYTIKGTINGTINDLNYNNRTFTVFNEDAIGIVESINFAESSSVTNSYGIVDQSLLTTDSTGNVNFGPPDNIPISYDGSDIPGLSEGSIYFNKIKLPPYPSFQIIDGSGLNVPIISSAYTKVNTFSNLRIDVPTDGTLVLEFTGTINFNASAATSVGMYLSPSVQVQIFNINANNGSSFIYTGYDNSSQDYGPGFQFNATGITGGLATINSSTYGSSATLSMFLPKNLISSSNIFASNHSASSTNLVPNMWLSASNAQQIFSSSILSLTYGNFTTLSGFTVYTASAVSGAGGASPTYVTYQAASAATVGSFSSLAPSMIIKDLNNNFYQIKSFTPVGSGVSFYLSSSVSGSVAPVSASVYNAIYLSSSGTSSATYSASAYNIFSINNTASVTITNQTASTIFSGFTEGPKDYGITNSVAGAYNNFRQSTKTKKIINLQSVPIGGVTINCDLLAASNNLTASIQYGQYLISYFPYSSYQYGTLAYVV